MNLTMALIALTIFAFLVGQALALPIDIESGLGGYAGYGGYGGFGGFLGYGDGHGYGAHGEVVSSNAGGCIDVLDTNCALDVGELGLGGSLLASDTLELGADVFYPGYGGGVGVGYGRAVGVERENFVRRPVLEYGIRDEVTYLPGYLRPPYSSFYNSYYPYNAYRGLSNPYGYNSARSFPLGHAGARSSILSDSLLWRR